MCLILRFYSNRKNLMLAKYSVFTVYSVEFVTHYGLVSAFVYGTLDDIL